MWAAPAFIYELITLPSLDLNRNLASPLPTPNLALSRSFLAVILVLVLVPSLTHLKQPLLSHTY